MSSSIGKSRSSRKAGRPIPLRGHKAWIYPLGLDITK
ncbi:phage DNA packaging protein J [Streptomyces sp. NPDC001165]